MIDALLLDRTPRQTRIALMSGPRAVEVLDERPSDELREGDIVLGRVAAAAQGIDGSFVELGRGRPGLLRGGHLAEGANVLVQVAAAARDGKGPRLTRRVVLAGRTATLEPGGAGWTVSRRIDDEREQDRLEGLAERLGIQGLTLRTAAAGTADEAIAAEARRLAVEAETLIREAGTGPAPRLLRRAPPALLATLRNHVGIARIVASSGDLLAWGRGLIDEEPWASEIVWGVAPEGPGLFEAAGIEAAIERGLASRVAIAGGAELAFTSGPALTAIDVDSARARRSPLACDLAAARAIPEEIRLRGIAGLIVVDFIGLADDREDRRVMRELRDGLRADRRVTACHGLSPLGLAEIARRHGPALIAAMREPNPSGDGGWRLTAPAIADGVAGWIAREAARRPGAMAITCAADVAEALADPSLGGLEALAAQAGGPLSISVDGTVPRDHPRLSRREP